MARRIMLMIIVVSLATKIACEGCPHPSPPSHGSWFCTGSSCHLECDPGYAASGRTSTSHSGGDCTWSPAPDKMTCSPAVVLATGGLLDVTGVEVYGPGIQHRLPYLPDNRVGASLDYVDSLIIVCGGSMIRGPPIPPFPPARDTCIQMSRELTWSHHSTMHQGRDVQASVVNLGKLMLLGGTDAPTSMDTMEPAVSGSWTESSIKQTKYACAAKISPTEFMVTGGQYYPSEVLKYDTLTGKTTPLANLKQKRSGHGCAFVKHGSMVGVMVAGGLPLGNQQWKVDVTRATTDHVEFYSLETGQWEVVGSLNEARRGLKLIFVQDTLYAMGGFNGKRYVSTVEKFDFATKTWKPAADMLVPRAFHGVVAVPQELFHPFHH